MLKTLSFFFLLLLTGYVRGQADYAGERLSLDEDWKFQLGDAAENDDAYHRYGDRFMPFSKVGRMKGVNALDYPDSAWQSVTLPHDWAVALPFVKDKSLSSHGFKPVGWKFPEHSEGWYRRTFSLPVADQDKRVFVKFDGVYRDCDVWLNGYYLGNHQGGYMEFMFDVTNFLRFDQENLLVVKVDATEYEGWWYEGAGIYRHAWLIKKSPLHVPEHGTYVTTEVADGGARVRVETTLRQSGDADVEAALALQLKDATGRVVAEQRQATRVSAGGTQTLTTDLTLDKPRLWSLDDPYRYTLVTTIGTDGRTVDRTQVPVGVRTLRFDPQEGFFLNGKSVKVKGACVHQDHAGVGVALPDRLHAYRIEKLKEMGVNAYRPAHHPPAPEILDACDRLGMLVMSETRALNSAPHAAEEFRNLILRDRNHPSVFLWSLGNEEMEVQNEETGRRVATTLKGIQQALDPSRLCTYGGNNGNQFEGVNEVVDVRGFNYMNISDIDQYHRDHPDQPLVGSEEASTLCTRGQYAMDTLRGYLTDYDKKENIPYRWCANAEEWWKFYDARPFLIGGFIWTGFDYRGEPSPYRDLSVNSHFGVMDVCGFPKNNYYYYQARWTDRDVLHLFPHWNWPGQVGEKINVWCQTNADEVELFLNGKSVGRRRLEKNGHLEWDVPYAPGVLEARAVRNGRRFATKVETTGPPAAIVLTPDRTTLTADGRDVSVLNVTVLDAAGRPVATADDFIVFEVEGAGRIIGVGNGDPASTEPDQITGAPYHRRLFNGRCQAILQTTGEAGAITVRATAERLKPTVVTLRTEAVAAGGTIK